MNTPTETVAVQPFALTLMGSHTYDINVGALDGTWSMQERTDTWIAGHCEMLVCGEIVFVRRTTKRHAGAYELIRHWHSMSRVDARKLYSELRSEGYKASEPETRVLGSVDFAGGDVWHSWGEGANRCGHVGAPAQTAPVIAYFKSVYDHVARTSSKHLDQIVTLHALTPDRNISEGDVANNQWYSYDAARKLVAGEWTATDPMIAVDSVNDCRKVELRVF